MVPARHVRLLVPVIATAAFVLLIVAIDLLGLFGPFDNALRDLALRLRGSQATDTRIVVVAVDEKSLERFGRWPIARTSYVPLLDRLHEAKAVAFDIIFAEPSADDGAFAEAIAHHGAVVLASYFDGRYRLLRPAAALRDVTIGHIHVEQDADGITRSVAHRLSAADGSVVSLAKATAAVARGRDEPPSLAASQPLPGRIRKDDVALINYYGPPGTFRTVSMVDVVDGRYSNEVFRGKLVLVGTTAAGLDNDILSSSVGGDRRMPGVEAQATILNNLLDGRTTSVVSDALRWLALIAACAAAFFAFVRVSPLRAALIWVGLAAALAAGGLVVLVAVDLWFPPTAGLLVLSATFIGSYTYRIDRMGAQLREATQDWEETFDSIGDAILIVDSGGAIVRRNRAGRSIREIDMPVLLTNGGIAAYQEERHDRETGRHEEITVLPRLDHEGAAHGHVVVIKDLSGRRRAEEEKQKLQSQLLQSQKMESIGRLAGGVAHDFNNLLTAILGFSELALRQRSADGPYRDYILSIHETGLKAKDLTTQLLAFSRRLVLEFKVVDLDAVVDGTAKMLGRIIGEDIRLELRTCQGKRFVKADRGQLEQALLNLVVNARDAMPDGGHLAIETYGVVLDEEYASSNEGVVPGPYAVLSVSDTGSGMTPDVKEHIFEPFFTTKESGKGTGLGLAMVYGIVNQHGGHLHVYSEPGRGTTLKIYLPAVRERTDGAEEEITSPTMRRGTETILVVEDDAYIRDLIGTVLTPLGYRVLLAADGGEALSASTACEGKIDLLLTDVIMPGMNGWELATRLCEMRPGLRVVYMSGYTQDVVVHHGVADPGVLLLQKPFTLGMLFLKLCEALDAKA